VYEVTCQRLPRVSIIAEELPVEDETMEPLCLPPHDEEDEFQKSLLDLLGSPIARHHNGASTLFNTDYNSTYGYGKSRWHERGCSRVQLACQHRSTACTAQLDWRVFRCSLVQRPLTYANVLIVVSVFA
jgi:hypothetical protein